MQANAGRPWAVEIECLDGFFNVGSQLVPGVALGEDALGQAFGAKAAVSFLGDFEYDFTLNLGDCAALSKWHPMALLCGVRRKNLEDVFAVVPLIDFEFQVLVELLDDLPCRRD